MVLETGEHISHYKILSHMAEGGSGNVYRAFDSVTEREVAIKIPSRSTLMDPRQFERFQREIDALASLNHPAVQRFIESGRDERTPYLVTELVQGVSLRHELKNGALPFDRAITLTRRIAEGVAYCHEQSVIHRDLKPENILIIQNDLPVIIDFGLALTKTHPNAGMAAGTPDYVAPEQMEGLRGDKRTDIYSLGAIVYEMLTGKAPFEGEDFMDVMLMRRSRTVPRLDQVIPGMSAQIATVVARCLQQKPEKRYPDMQSLIRDLDHLDQIDTSCLEELTATPPKPSFFKTQLGQGILMTGGMILGIIVLTVVLVALKH